ncbi:MAG: hypothetical protein ACYC35_26710 [Pirellulales bacterium]
MKRTAIDHPKLRRLAKLLDVPHYAAVGIMESLWQFTAKHAIRGDIGKWTDAEIAAAIDWPEDESPQLVKALVEARLVDRHATHRLIVHDWPEHADDSTRKTVRNHGWEFIEPDAALPEMAGTFPEDSGKVANGSETVAPSQSQSQSQSLSQSLSQSQSQSQARANAPAAPPADAGPPSELFALVDAWNAFNKSIIQNHVKTDPLPKAVVNGWRKAQHDPELREALKDIPAIVAAVRRAKFCHAAGWFSLAWLFGKNKNGENNLPRLLNGAFDHDNGRSNGRSSGPGPGQVFDPAYIPAATF